ncbi:hypothetical protein Avbf_14048 [Armadillidium vulgare]|nr:hypothetical protein Avbf_14048 [Armadillidium vulgare]
MDNWAEESSLYLIEVYKSHPMLWDPKDPNYYRKSVKEDAWREISDLLGQSEDKCRNKMLSLLSSYRRERAKENKLKGTYKFNYPKCIYNAQLITNNLSKTRRRVTAVGGSLMKRYVSWKIGTTRGRGKLRAPALTPASVPSNNVSPAPVLEPSFTPNLISYFWKDFILCVFLYDKNNLKLYLSHVLSSDDIV